MNRLDMVNQAFQSYRLASVNTKISPNDSMANEWYEVVGRSAVDVVLAALMSSQVEKVERVLDVPCGHGRVLRHLVHLFPKAELYACDLDVDGVAFCASEFGATPVVSRPELSEVNFGVKFDLIWVGSLFTHVSQAQAARWMLHLAQCLTPTGIVVATVHGRWCVHAYPRVQYIGAERWQSVLNEYKQLGYGYADYLPVESHAFIAGNYGISLASAQSTLQMVQAIPGVRVHSYSERAWATHQDVVVFGGPAYDAPWD